MSSKRLPGKVLMKIQGKTMLERVVERVLESKNVTKVIVATSKNSEDLPLRKLCFKKNIKYYAGNLNNVADRFYKIIKKFHSKAFIRISADSPLIDPCLIDNCLVKFNNNSFDIVTNVYPRTYPIGQSVEIIKSSVFKNNLSKMKKEIHLEHITKFFYENKKSFKINNIKNKKNYSKFNMSINTLKDINKVRNIYKQIPHSYIKKIGWKEIINNYYEKKKSKKN